jgi:thymidylate synthase ThyX
MWVEAERYRFLEFVSSQSTMHRITKFKIRDQYNEYVDPRVIDIMEEKVSQYNKLLENKPEKGSEQMLEDYAELLKKKYLEILYTNPAGFELTARMTTNYRCLLNIYIQRYNHRLPEWREFCAELLKLPYFPELLEAYKSGGKFD